MPSRSLLRHPRPADGAQVAPGVRVLPVDLRKIPAVLVAEAVEKRVTFADGTKGIAYVYVNRVHDAWMRVTEAAEKLPLGLSEEVILTLIRAGFVEGSRAAPHSCMVNVVSLLEHIDTTADDPDFWTRERLQTYKDYSVWKKRHKSKKGRE
jgi:hypothetical protein